MAERRQATRREPIEVETEDGRVFTAHPLSWIEANNLGNEIVRQNVENANDFVRLWMNDADMPQIEMKFQQKISDWGPLVAICFPNEPDEKWHEPRELSSHELADCIIASLDVNHLEHLKHLVDPNSPTPMIPGGTSSSPEPEGNGTKIESIPNSDSTDSIVPTPSS